MTSFKSFANTRLACSATAIGLALSAMAHADVTAEQVWADWQAYMSAGGYSISATEARDGDALVVTDILMVSEIPEEDVKITISMPELTLTDVGDGTVSIGLLTSIPLGVQVDSEESGPVDVLVNYTTSGWSGIVSGEPDELLYTYSADQLGMTVEEIGMDGVTIAMSTMGAVEIKIADLAGSSKSTNGDLYEMAQKLSTGAINYLVDVVDPEGGEGRLVLKGNAASLESAVTASLPADADMNDMAAMMAQGFAVDAQLGLTGGSIDMNFNDTGEVFQLQTSSASNGLGVAMSEDGLRYSLSSTDQKVFVAGTEIPFPIELAAKENGFSIQMPVSASDEVQPFGLDVTLADFVMSDLIWGLVDPTGQLPRDPATVSVALAGTAKLLTNVLDPMAMAQMGGGEQPGELHSLDVTGLTLRAAGAELLGDGSFTFDNSDLATFDGLPAPTGKLNLSLSGGNGLLDKLVSMGLIPDQEASGVRMMMGLFAVPGSAPDTLNSTIEVQGNGQIFANGQRIQ